MQAPPGALTILEAATELNVDPRLVRSWIKTGKLKALRPGKQFRITRSEWLRFKASISTA